MALFRLYPSDPLIFAYTIIHNAPTIYIGTQLPRYASYYGAGCLWEGVPPMVMRGVYRPRFVGLQFEFSLFLSRLIKVHFVM